MKTIPAPIFKPHLLTKVFNGEKTMTRRIVKPQPMFGLSNYGNGYWSDPDESGEEYSRCPYGVPGTRWYFREGLKRGRIGHIDDAVTYTRDGEPAPGCWQWRRDWLPSIHMPALCARKFAIVTDVRVQRVQEITQEDAVAEGVDDTRDMAIKPGRVFYAGGPRDAFMVLWESIHGAGSWDANEWVWAISFRREP